MENKNYLLFGLNDEFFGIDVDYVVRVIDLEKMMKIPKAPSFIAGAINMEGNVVPVVDLAKKIDLGETTITEKTKCIILEIHHEDETMGVGVMIDAVHDVTEISQGETQPPPLENMGFDTHTLEGMFKSNENFYMLINAVKVFEKELSSMI